MVTSIKVAQSEIGIGVGPAELRGTLGVPSPTTGVVLFAHGSGSGRHSPRNRFVAEFLNRKGFATLLLDLLTTQEEQIDGQTRQLRFDIELLAGRLVHATDFLQTNVETEQLPIGLFGASTGAAAALIAAAERPSVVRAVVSRGGRPDLAGWRLPAVQAATLLIVGGHDERVIELNRQAYAKLQTARQLEIVPGATHLFEEPGTLERVAGLSASWFGRYLAG